MIKHLLMFAICFATVASYAVIPVNFSWQTTDPTVIDGCAKWNEANNKDFDKVMWNCVLKTMKDLSAKDATTISYVDFKKLILDNFVNIPKHKQYVPQFVNCISRFNAFAIDVINDEELMNDKLAKQYANMFVARMCFKDLPITQFREIFVGNIINLTNTNRTDIVDKWVILYKIRTIEIDNAEMLKDLKKVKKLIYPNINISEDWKKVVVDIELMIKSIE